MYIVEVVDAGADSCGDRTRSADHEAGPHNLSLSEKSLIIVKSGLVFHNMCIQTWFPSLL